MMSKLHRIAVTITAMMVLFIAGSEFAEGNNSDALLFTSISIYLFANRRNLEQIDALEFEKRLMFEQIMKLKSEDPEDRESVLERTFYRGGGGGHD